MRGMGAANTNPTPVEAKNRVRLLLMGAAPEVAAATHEKPQASGASVLLEEAQPTYLSARALDLEQEAPPVPEVPDADVTMVENLVYSGRPCPAPPTSSQPDADEDDEDDDDQPAAAHTPPVAASLERQALTYVAGYVAAKCMVIDPSLGQITSAASTEPRDERHAWILALSRGGLVVPSSQWLREVEELEDDIFFAMHGKGIDRGTGVVRRLTQAALKKLPNRDPRVLKKYAMTRTQVRVRELQRAIGEDAARKAAEKPVRAARRTSGGASGSRPEDTSRRAAKRARYFVPPK